MSTERTRLARLTAEIKELSNPDIYWHKISDMPSQTTKKPFDVIGMYKGWGFVIEFKKSGGVVSPHQRDNLLAYHNAGGAAFVGLFHDYKKDLQFYTIDRWLDKCNYDCLTYNGLVSNLIPALYKFFMEVSI